jgi:hypothetical protein
MTRADLIPIALWLATIALMIGIAWEPWQRTRRMTGLELPGDVSGRVHSPLFVFAPVVAVTAMPFMAQLAPRPGVNVWLHPHLLMPFGAIIPLVVFVAAQMGLRTTFLHLAQRLEAEREQRLAVFDKASARSARKPRV